jgi:hypothetical protein
LKKPFKIVEADSCAGWSKLANAACAASPLLDEAMT